MCLFNNFYGELNSLFIQFTFMSIVYTILEYSLFLFFFKLWDYIFTEYWCHPTAPRLVVFT